MQSLLRNLELILTLVGLLVVFIATVMAGTFGLDPWKTATAAAVAVGLIHGLLFWVLRRRRRSLREAAFLEIQAMLSDIINNQLTIIQISGELPASSPVNANTNATAPLERLNKSVNVISTALKTLSEESLDRWKSRANGS
jgi:membrane protein implicated in regulation of membrane protease activity